MKATVRVAVATLWREPTTDRPADRDALGEVTDIRAWCAGLDDTERMRPAVLSQLLLGERVLIEEEHDGWARVIAMEQPADDLDPRGYPGWLPRHQLTAADGETASPPAVVAVTATTLRDAPEGDLVLPGVVLGTRLDPASGRRRAVEGSTGEVHADAWRAVGVPGDEEARWARALDLAELPPQRPAPRDVLMTASRLRDVPYVWGGLSPFGIDCSGLVHLSWRRFGVTLPRDAYNQALAVAPVELDEERPGDLYFFARPGERIHHVGIVAAAPRDGKRVMLHACATQGRVVIEELSGERAETLVGAGRV